MGYGSWTGSCEAEAAAAGSSHDLNFNTTAGARAAQVRYGRCAVAAPCPRRGFRSKVPPAFLPWHRKSCSSSARSQLSGYRRPIAKSSARSAHDESLTPRARLGLVAMPRCRHSRPGGFARSVFGPWRPECGEAHESGKAPLELKRQHDHPRQAVSVMPDEITGGGRALTEGEAEHRPQKNLWGLMGAITQAKNRRSISNFKLRLSPGAEGL